MMNQEAILHIPLSSYAYATEEHKLTLRIRTAKNDMESVYVCYGDRVALTEPIPVHSLEMKRIATDTLYDYYEVTFDTDFTRVCYYFKLCSAGKIYYYYSRGLHDQMEAHRTEYFQFPFIRREELMTEPDWVYESVMYHIFPDSFASRHRQISLSAAEIGQSRSLLGGTLRGIIENVDYLADLGVNFIYLNPIFRANSYHKYDTIDYFDIDPCLGTKADFEELVSALHHRGMRIILDGVFNHCGPDFFAFQDVMTYQEKSKYKDWFYHLTFPIAYTDPPNYDCFAYVKEMPKLNTSNPEVRDYICKVGRYWIEEFNIDGWRLDVANEVDHETWRAFRQTVKSIKPDAFLIAEIWEEATTWLLPDQFDSAMNYEFTNLCRDFFATGKIDAKSFDWQIQHTLMRYPAPVTLAQMNFLDSHDIPRFLEACNHDVSRLRLALFYLMMAPGIPSVFYGDELLISGQTEPQYRAPMPWELADSPKQQTLKDDLAYWITMRKSHKALCRGDYRSLYSDKNGVYIFSRTYEDETIIIALNNSNQAQSLSLPWGDKTSELNLHPHDGQILIP